MKGQRLKAWHLAAALMVGASGHAQAEGAAAIAVEAAKAYAGTAITIVCEAGAPALEPLMFSGPRWKELTGIEVEVIEVAAAEMLIRILAEHRADTGAYDALNVMPSWMPDLLQAGALLNLGPYVDRYGYRAELRDIAPAYRQQHMTADGEIYAVPDDGDVLLLYYRSDIFAANGLEPPGTWTAFAQIGRKLTKKYGPATTAGGGVRLLYGAALSRDPRHAQLMFQERFRVEGGRFFDPETMRATVNSAIGVKVFTEMRTDNAFMPPGVESWGADENVAAFLAGKTAMTISWPTLGRWAAGAGTDEDAPAGAPPSQIAGRVGYALPPAGRPQLAGGFSLAVSSSSRNQEPAYLFIQWMNSKDVSLQRVQLPYALRDPFRESHFGDKGYRSRWPRAADFLATLEAGASAGLIGLSLIQIQGYEEALANGISRLWVGGDPQAILDDVAAQWDALTEDIGIDRQREAYQAWAARPNAYPD